MNARNEQIKLNEKNREYIKTKLAAIPAGMNCQWCGAGITSKYAAMAMRRGNLIPDDLNFGACSSSCRRHIVEKLHAENDAECARVDRAMDNEAKLKASGKWGRE